VHAVTFTGSFTPTNQADQVYQLPTAGGSVSATATWDGGGTLTLTLNCPGAQQKATGSSGVSVAVTSQPGSCSLIVGDPQPAGSLSYQLAVQYVA
jgi:hypothetical protein